MLGRLSYQINKRAWNRPSLYYAREILRPRILKSPPVAGTTDGSAEIHVLTSSEDWLNLIWSLKSFYLQVDRKYALAIHGDPALPREAVDTLQAHFPDARVIQQKDVREEVLNSLQDYPLCHKLRATNTLSIKSFDFVHTLQADRMILFDSDLLFYARPDAFLRHLHDDSQKMNVFNGDVSTAYAVDIPTIEACGFKILPEINSGFGVVHSESMRLDWMEEFLEIPGIMEGHFWRIEQTLFALCGSRFGAKLLPEDYRVALHGRVRSKPFRHYVGAVRDQMYLEGMRKLRKTLLGGGVI